MPNEDIGLELMRLYRQLRSEPDPRVKTAIRQHIDLLLDRAQNVIPAGYAGVTHKNT
jgi:hypothetical protein